MQIFVSGRKITNAKCPAFRADLFELFGEDIVSSSRDIENIVAEANEQQVYMYSESLNKSHPVITSKGAHSIEGYQLYVESFKSFEIQ